MRRVLFPLVLLLLLVGGLNAATLNAQATNLLQQGGFEDGYTGRSIPQGADVAAGSINVPSAWGFWVTQVPRTESWMNLVPTVFPHNGPNPDPHGGSRALNMTRDGSTFTTAVFQQVGVTAGTNVRGSAWAFLKTCKPNPTDCSSEPSSGARVRVGIDPAGGTDPTNAAIIWSAFITPHNAWQQATVDATATGGTVTIFLYSTQNFPASGGGLTFNRVYWDDAELIVGGAGGVGAVPGATAVPPTPTPIPFVPFVAPQSARPDGSIVHVVQDGDTIASIAFAYGVSVEEILALNPTIGGGRFIFPGQEILVKGPSENPPTATPGAVAAEPTTDPNAGGAPPASFPQITPAPIQQPTVIPLGPAFGGQSGGVPENDTGQASADPPEEVAALPTNEQAAQTTAQPVVNPTQDAPVPEATEAAESAQPTAEQTSSSVQAATNSTDTPAATVDSRPTLPPAETQPTQKPTNTAAPPKPTIADDPQPTDAAVEAPDQVDASAEDPAEVTATETDSTVAPTLAPTTADTTEVVASAPTATPTSQPTAMPTATPTHTTTPQQVAQVQLFASVCVAMFEDSNQNGLREDGEALVAGGTLEVITPNNVIVGSHTTDGASEPHCFTQLDIGEYIAIASAPAGYRLTMAQQVRLAPSENTQIAFGAAPEEAVVAEPADAAAQPQSDAANPQLPQIALLVIAGLAGIIIVAGMALTLILRRRGS